MHLTRSSTETHKQVTYEETYHLPDNTDVQVPNMQTCHLRVNTHAEKGSYAWKHPATQDTRRC